MIFSKPPLPPTFRRSARASQAHPHPSRIHGFSLIEVLFGMFLLAAAGIVFSALYPLGTKMSASARYRGQAIRIARGEMEALRRVALDSGKFDYIRNKDVASLKTKLDVNEAVVDNNATATAMTFTGVPLTTGTGVPLTTGETIDTVLPGGVGLLTVTTDSPAAARTIVKVTVQWTDPMGPRSVDVYGILTKYMK